MSDKEITQKYRFLDYVEYGDNVMADRGFNVANHLALCGACLLIHVPAYMKEKPQLSKQEIEKLENCSSMHPHKAGDWSNEEEIQDTP